MRQARLERTLDNEMQQTQACGRHSVRIGLAANDAVFISLQFLLKVS